MGGDTGITVHNVVSIASLGREISLETVLTVFENVKKPANFPGVVYRPEGCKATVLLFKSGRLVAAGARSWEESIHVIEKTVGKLREVGLVDDVQVVVNILNMVATFDLYGPVDIEKLSEKLENVVYEPFIFPGLIHWMRDPRVSILLFQTGKGICAGAKNIEEIHQAVGLLKKTLEENGLIAYPVMP